MVPSDERIQRAAKEVEVDGGKFESLSPMSSGAELMVFVLVCLGVGEHGAVDGVGDAALEGPDGSSAGSAGFLAAIEVGPCVVPGTFWCRSPATGSSTPLATKLVNRTR